MDTFSWTSKSQYKTELYGVELLWNSIEFHKLCFRRIPWNSISQYQPEFPGIFSFEFHRIPWNSMGLFYMGNHRIDWDSAECVTYNTDLTINVSLWKAGLLT